MRTCERRRERGLFLRQHVPAAAAPRASATTTRRQWLRQASASAFASAVACAPFARPSWAGDSTKPGSQLLVVSGPQEQEALRGVFLVDPEQGTWRRVLEATSPIVRLSPDGRTLLSCHPENPDDFRHLSAWLSPVDGHEPARKLADPADRAYWSPDGREILISSVGQRPTPKPENWIIDADGSNRRKLPVPPDEFVGDCSPDGAWLLTYSIAGTGRGRIVRIRKRDGAELARLEARPADNLHRFTPDSRAVVFAREESRTPARYSLYIVNRDGTGEHPLVAGTPELSPYFFCWSPDGKHLAADMMEREKLGNDQYNTIRRRIEIFTAEGKPERKIELPQHEVLPVDWR